MNPVLSATDTFTATEPRRSSRVYAWAVFALTFGLMLSDYLSRQVIGAVIPAIQGGMGAVVFPTRHARERGLAHRRPARRADLAGRRPWGRVKSITLMAFVWCLATIAAASRRVTRNC
jgi:hypothetical protein